MNEMNIRTSLSSVDPRDERIYELEDKIEELQLELDQKNIIIRQKDAVSNSIISIFLQTKPQIIFRKLKNCSAL